MNHYTASLTSMNNADRIANGQFANVVLAIVVIGLALYGLNQLISPQARFNRSIKQRGYRR